MVDYTMPERAHTALLTVDAQRDYFAQQSPVRSTGCGQVREPLRQVVEAFREQQLPIFHLIRFYRADASNVDLCRRKAVEEGMRVLMPGSMGAELIPEVAPADCPRIDPHLLLDGGVQALADGEEAIYKPRWGGFYRTPLEERLSVLGVNTVVICGCNFATSGRATVLEASERDFRVVMVPEACAGLSDEGQRELCRVGVHLMRVDQCQGWIAGRKNPGQAA
ncbi:cysteine hydrolase family protein [Ferruginivarius sediminum]|uniref:Cysteine hydrolase n=1 Tax=Ferruginivarius sediminum TaxID=2661937 RepID=A0A369T8K8_9PROT|nr:isochorismatase family cysteine hydrolase [Ferruginivarius sediminum]RDD61659.1 cysteine hydrolase [Ferruginivarius sediminum]